MTSLGLRARAAATRPDRRAVFEYAAAAAASLVVIQALRLYGPAFTLVGVLLGTFFVAAIANLRIFVTTVLLLAPLPSLGALAGGDFPLGLEPLNLLVVIGIGVALLTRQRLVRPSALLTGAILVNLLLLTVAWMRTYGADGIRPSDVALIVKPALIILAGFLLVGLLPRKDLIRVLAIGMFSVMMLVEVSVVLQRAGLYQTSFQADNISTLQFKQFGGIMLQGNVAGAFIAIFTIPTYLLLREAGLRALGVIVLLAAFPVLLVTLSRGSMAGFLVAMLTFVALTRRRVRAAGLILAMAVLATAFAVTVGESQTEFLVDRFNRAGANTNAQLSGRQSIWTAAFEFLSGEPHRLWVGGGLDSFRDFALRSLGGAFATHNGILYALTTGGILMLASFVALSVVAFVGRPKAPAGIKLAIRVAVVTTAVVSLSSDAVPFAPIVAWLWVLLALAERLAREPDPQPAPAGGAS